MDKGTAEIVGKHLFYSIGLKYSYLLLIYLFMAFLLNEIIIWGNDLLAAATDDMLGGESIELGNLLVPLLLMIVVGSIVAFGKSLSGSQYSSLVQREIRSKLGSHLLEMPFSYFDEKGTGGIMQKLTSDISEVGRFFSEILPELLMSLVTVITITIYLIQMDARLILVLFVSYPFMLLVSNKLSNRLAEIARKFQSGMDERTQIAYDAIQGITVCRSYQLYEPMKRRIDVVIDENAEHGCKSTRISSMGWVLRNVLTTIPIIFCYLFGLYETLTNRITAGEMLAFTVLLGQIIYPLGDIMFCLGDIRTVGVSVKRLQDIWTVSPEMIEKENRKEKEGTEKPKMEGKEPVILWKNVIFSYEGDREVLKGLSFSVNQGEMVALVGGSGEGKSTVFKLLCHFYTKTGGEYWLFGRKLEEWNLQALRDCFSYVSQNIFLLPKSIYENVACGKEIATRDEVIEVCKAANIHDFIMSLPQGYDTIVGERGTRLSGGERQRISLARAFLKDAPIILLDEPTASVDVDTEAAIQEAISGSVGNKTVLVIAHRLSTVKQADCIFVVSEGRIAEQGTHLELMRLQGIYAEMYGKEVTADGLAE